MTLGIMRCNHCAGISIRRLIELAAVEFDSCGFPLEAYYKHHASIENLVSSADKGCDLCRLILHAFKNTPSADTSKGKTVFDIVKDVEQSDLRISIGADHLGEFVHFSEVEMFDVLLVQVGYPAEPDASQGEEEYPEPNYVQLALQVPREEPLSWGKYKIGRITLDPNLASETNYTIAKDWLRKCCETHKECPRDISLPLPTRVIDVGILGGPLAPRLLVSSGATGRYAALSHCWGGPISSVLTTESLEVFQKALPYSDLPLNFRDAISITRHLGISYLWIDSLCILQDSTADWETESSMMVSVYRQALVTISALSSEGSSHGILKHDETFTNSMEFVQIPLDEGSGTAVYARTKMPDEETLRDLEIHGKLSSRGWALQESMLSPRQLCYGRRQIYWKCSHKYEASEGTPPGYELQRWNLNSLPAFLSSGTTECTDTSAPQLEFPKYREEYYTLVEIYTSRELTIDSDKLSAFSALARLIHPAFGGVYLAGIWTTDFRNGLLWSKKGETCWHSRERYAPSWSWADAKQPVRRTMIRDPELESSPYDVQLVTYDLQLRNKQDPYGQVVSCQLIVRGITINLIRSSQRRYIGRLTGFVYFDEPEEGGEIETASHVCSIKVDGEEHMLSWFEGEQCDKIERKIDTTFFSHTEYTLLVIHGPTGGISDVMTECLVLTPVAGTDTFQRVGRLLLYSDYMNPDSWRWRTMTLA